MAHALEPPTSITFLLWKPGQKAQRDIRRSRHTAIFSHRQRKLTNAKASVQATKKHTTKDNADALRRIPNFDRQDASHPEKPFTGCLDPFNTISTEPITAPKQAVLQFAIIHQWPCFAFSTHKSAVTQWLSQTMNLAMGNPCLLHTMLYAGASYQLFLGSQHESLRQLRMTSYMDTLASLRLAVSQPDAYISDAMLLSIAMLALIGSTENPVRIARSTDPMYRDNEFYSSGGWEPAHVNALLTLTKQRGGTKSFELHNLAEMIVGIDTHDAMCHLRKPMFPPLIPTSKSLHGFRGYWDAVAVQKYDETDNGFDFLPHSKTVTALLDVVSKARALFATYDTMLNNPSIGIDIVRWVVTRRAIQNEAMSIEASGDCLFRMCRLAVQMFIAESIEPMAELCLYHQNSSRALLLAVDECDRMDYWEMHPEVLVWATVVGGYTARESSIRWWYAEQLRHSPIPLEEQCWIQVQELSERFLPFRYRQGEGLRQFWENACTWLSGPKLPK